MTFDLPGLIPDLLRLMGEADSETLVGLDRVMTLMR
jgi:hypothetical protein